MAALYTWKNENVFKLWMKTYVDNQLKFLPGNATVRDQVAQGILAYGITDTDDAFAALDEGKPVRMVYLAQDKEGTFIIPNTVAMINDAPHPSHAKTFIDYLLSPEIEEKLANTRAKQIPVRSSVPVPNGVPSLSSIKAEEVNYEEIAKNLDACLDVMREFHR
jgi:iron(III) transport system substrate-binding protein